MCCQPSPHTSLSLPTPPSGLKRSIIRPFKAVVGQIDRNEANGRLRRTTIHNLVCIGHFPPTSATNHHLGKHPSTHQHSPAPTSTHQHHYEHLQKGRPSTMEQLGNDSEDRATPCRIRVLAEGFGVRLPATAAMSTCS